MTFLPISRCRYTAPLVILLVFAVAATQTVVGGTRYVVTIWSGVGVASLVAAILWDEMNRMRLVRSRSVVTYMIAFVLLTTAATVPPLFFFPVAPDEGVRPSESPMWLPLVALGGQAICVTVLLNQWQCRYMPVAWLVVGLVTGGLSTLHAHFLLWLLWLPGAFYQMRCFSSRNVWAALTGTVLAVWLVYAGTFIFAGAAMADKMLSAYATFADFSMPEIRDVGLWPALCFALYAVPALFFSLVGLLPSSGDSVRAGGSKGFLGAAMLVTLAWTVADGTLLAVHLTTVAFFLAIQVSIWISNTSNAVGEWWVTLTIAAMLALGVVPFFY